MDPRATMTFLDHVAACAAHYWNGRYPWGDHEMLDNLRQSDAADNRRAADEITQLETVAFEWMRASAPVDWTSPDVKAALQQRLASQFPWCDARVFAGLWTRLSWLGWHEGY